MNITTKLIIETLEEVQQLAYHQIDRSVGADRHKFQTIANKLETLIEIIADQQLTTNQ